MSNEELIKLAKNGDKFALKELFENNVGLINNIIKKFSNVRMEYDDIYSICRIGLYKAYQKYDSSKNVTFYEFAKKIIINEILKEVTKSKAKFRCDDTIKEVSLYTKVGTEDENNELIDNIPIHDSRFNQFEMNEYIQSIIKKANLKKNELLCITKHFYENKNARQIGEDVGFSRQYADLQLKSGLKKLKNSVNLH